jgi:hypothetical protein
LDQAIDAPVIKFDPKTADEMVARATQNGNALSNVNSIIRAILKNDSARVVRSGRGYGSRKIQVLLSDELILPNLNALSAGQITLLSIFGTILRYADSQIIASPTEKMDGIVIIDEIDAHLHADLQYEVLPRIMKLFPKIQFIVTSHSPLFPFGMLSEYGEGNFTMLEVPSGRSITPERFSEFSQSFDYYTKTKRFEAEITERVVSAVKPLVLCEGQTDPIYLKTAADVLGYETLLSGIEFDWIGRAAPGGAQGGGKDKLAQARKLLTNNPNLIRTKVLLLFDFEQKVEQVDIDNLHVRTIPENSRNQICRAGIENLLPERLFTPEFYDKKVTRTGDITTREKLRKTALCEAVCEHRRSVGDFEGFRPVLDMLVSVLSI